MNRFVFGIVLAGVATLVVGLMFYFFPISIFPCEFTNGAGGIQSTMCSLRDANGETVYLNARLTGSGQIVQLLVLLILPLTVGFAAGYRMFSKRSDRNSTDSRL
jgi:hypothetical protein